MEAWMFQVNFLYLNNRNPEINIKTSWDTSNCTFFFCFLPSLRLKCQPYRVSRWLLIDLGYLSESLKVQKKWHLSNVKNAFFFKLWSSSQECYWYYVKGIFKSIFMEKGKCIKTEYLFHIIFYELSKVWVLEWTRAGQHITGFLNLFFCCIYWLGNLVCVSGFVLVVGKFKGILHVQTVFFYFTVIKDEWPQQMVTDKSQQPLFRNLLSSEVSY